MTNDVSSIILSEIKEAIWRANFPLGSHNFFPCFFIDISYFVHVFIIVFKAFYRFQIHPIIDLSKAARSSLYDVVESLLL